MVEERRQFSRVEFESKVQVDFSDNKHEAELIDISLKGALIKSNSAMNHQQGESCTFELSLQPSDMVLKVDALLVYKKDEQMGLKFGNIDLESMIHLRRLVELNTGDAELVQKELFFLVDAESM